MIEDRIYPWSTIYLSYGRKIIDLARTRPEPRDHGKRMFLIDSLGESVVDLSLSLFGGEKFLRRRERERERERRGGQERSKV
jgi:hypothetical protein